EIDDADRVASQQQRDRGCPVLVLASNDEMPGALVGCEIVGDLERLLAECGPCEAAAARMLRIDGNLQLVDRLDRAAGCGCERKPMLASLLQEDRRGTKGLSGTGDRIANQLEHLLAVGGVQDGRVRGAEGRKHVGETAVGTLSLGALEVAFEDVQCERYVG